MPERRHRERVYPLGEMEVGDSFTVPKSAKGTLSGRIWKWQNHPDFPGRRFTTRVVDTNTIRVWRVK